MLTMRPLLRESVGGMLRRVRKTQGLSLDMIAERTRIQRKYIEALEQDAYNEVPDILTARRMLLKLVETLGIDQHYLVARFDQECGSCPTPHTLLRLPRQKTVKRWLASWPRIGLWSTGVALTGAVLFFIGLHAQSLLGAPPLLVDSPNTDIHTTASLLEVSGQTEPGVHIVVNDVPAFPDPTGRFQTQLPLRFGYNEVTVQARRKFGRMAQIVRHVFLELPPTLSVPLTHE